jgi:hypothetical protein
VTHRIDLNPKRPVGIIAAGRRASSASAPDEVAENHKEGHAMKKYETIEAEHAAEHDVHEDGCPVCEAKHDDIIAQMRRIIIDGIKVALHDIGDLVPFWKGSLAEFIDDNPDELTNEDIANINIGKDVSVGGGAAPAWVIRKI